MPPHTSSASAICGIASGRTNDTASIRWTPVPDSRSISSIFACVGTGSSFCRPSLGPTSRTEIAAGRSDTHAPFLVVKTKDSVRLTGRQLLMFPGLLFAHQPVLLVLDELEE